MTFFAVSLTIGAGHTKMALSPLRQTEVFPLFELVGSLGAKGWPRCLVKSRLFSRPPLSGLRLHSSSIDTAILDVRTGAADEAAVVCQTAGRGDEEPGSWEMMEVLSWPIYLNTHAVYC